MSLQKFDKTKHDEDEYETPSSLFEKLCERFEIDPILDVCATEENKKCLFYFTKQDNSILLDWTVDSWCNPPHSETGFFVKKAYLQWIKHNINIMLIIPTNCMSAKFWHDCIENHAEYHAIEGRIRFLQNGKPAKFRARNAYVCVIFRKR